MVLVADPSCLLYNLREEDLRRILIMSIDDQLLQANPAASSGANSKSSSGRSGELRANRRRTSQANKDTERAVDFRTRIQEAKREKRRQEAKEAKEGGGSLGALLASPAKKAVSNLLQQSWVNIFSSWGLTLIWINCHVFLHNIIPSLFCKLGDECKPENCGSASMTNLFLQTIFGKHGLSEPMALAVIDGIALLILFSLFCLVALIVGFFSNPFEAIASILKDIIGNMWK